ncbi:MAG: GGDEF domain-containing protein [Proteobacteria bacterium]|nr:MAG: GGDEF domain-containing protein [Pseudomonadota bacterium]QKK10529.1 MAG: GGDEF domain-containing protein [Pseudomonadota bacterium]
MKELLQKRAFRYGAAGALFGLAYALLGHTVERYDGGAGAYVFIQVAPILFGLLAFAIGREEDRIRAQARTLDEARERFSSLTHAAITERKWDVSFYDTHIPTCWLVKGCTHTECPSYGEHHIRCWLVSGTHCRGAVQGRFAAKLGDCAACDIYQASFGRGPISEIAENFNSLMWALREKEDLLTATNNELNSQYAELKALQEKTKAMAESDALTGLGNHGHFQQRLQEEVARAERYGHTLTLLLLDLDHFKQINDRYGHQKGDAVLSSFGKIMKTGLRDVDYAARYGGEEFAVIMPETDGAGAMEIAERLRRKMGEVAKAADLPAMQISASFGVADFPACATDGAGLVAAADAALLFAKRTGRDRVVYYRNLSETEHENSDLWRISDSQKSSIGV